MGRRSDGHPQVNKQQPCGPTGPVDTAEGPDSPPLPYWLSLGVQQYLLDTAELHGYAMPGMLNVALAQCTELFLDVDLNICEEFRECKTRIWHKRAGMT